MNVSVVIANFNYAHLIEGAVASVLGNEGGLLREIIVVDDRSTDDSREVLQRLYADHEKVRLVFNEENRGQLSCFRTGIGMARGDVISFLDPDDRYENRCLEEVVRVFGERPEVDFVYTGYRDVGEREEVVLKAERDFDIGSTRMMTALTGRHFWSITSTIFLRRKLARRIMALPEHYDWEFESRVDTVIELASTIVGSYRYYLAQPLMLRTIHETNYSHTVDDCSVKVKRYKEGFRRVRAFFFRDCAIPDDSPGALYREFRDLPSKDRKTFRDYLNAAGKMRLSLFRRWGLRFLLVKCFYIGRLPFEQQSPMP